MKKVFIGLVLMSFVVIGVVFYFKMINKNYVSPEENLEVTSEAFENGKKLPVQYTGFGEDISPNLIFRNIQSDGKYIAIIMDDLDTPIGRLNHWVIWNIPVKYKSIPSGIEKKSIVESLDGASQGKNSYGSKNYYRGPKPPAGIHRYVFQVYVLDEKLSIDENSRKKDLQRAMKGHIIQYGTIEGTFEN